MVVRDAAVAKQNLVRCYDDGAGWPNETSEKERAFREGFLTEARRVALEWARPPWEPLPGSHGEGVSQAGLRKKTRGDFDAETEAARKQRECIREQHSVYHEGSEGPKTHHWGYLPGHEVPAARARGPHHALVYVIEPWPDAATAPIEVFAPKQLLPWLAAVEQWAASPMRPEAPVPPPTLAEVKAATAPLIPVVTNQQEPALACPVCGFNYIHPVAIECRSPGQANGHLRIDSHGIHLNPTVPPAGRGVMIALTFLCEDGHLFTYQMHFHKGMTFLERTLADAPQEIDLRPRTIWRN